MTSKSSVNTERSNSFSSDSVETSNDDPSDTPTLLENRSNSEPFNSTMVVVTSPSFNSDLSSEQNDSIDQLNSSSSSSSFLQTQQRRINHRRNKSEPFKSISNEDLSSTTSNDIKDEIRRKSSSSKSKHLVQEKTPPSSTITTRKKKAWYNVSTLCIYIYIYHYLFSTLQ